MLAHASCSSMPAALDSNCEKTWLSTNTQLPPRPFPQGCGIRTLWVRQRQVCLTLGCSSPYATGYPFEPKPARLNKFSAGFSKAYRCRSPRSPRHSTWTIRSGPRNTYATGIVIYSRRACKKGLSSPSLARRGGSVPPDWSQRNLAAFAISWTSDP